MKKTAISLRLNQDSLDDIDHIAQNLNRDRSYIINEAVDNYLDIYKWQIEHIKKSIEQADDGIFVKDSDAQNFFGKIKK